MEAKEISTDEVNVTASMQKDKEEISVSKIDIPIAQIKKIRIGGESDVFRSLQYLPGVLTSSQISSGLYVRGGSPDQNLVLLDGSVVYNPNHLFGFISAFNTEAIKDVELVKGGYPAEFGSRLSAVLNITQNDGNLNKLEGDAAIGLISSKLSLNGPGLIKGSSFYVAARRTYLEIIKSFIHEDPKSPFPDFHFYDVNAKYTQNLGENDKISASGFLSSDVLNYGGIGVDFGINLSNSLAALKWNHVFSNSLFLSTNFNVSEYINKMLGNQSGYDFIVNNSIKDYTVKSSLDWFISNTFNSKFGVEINNYQFKYLQNFTGNTDSTQTGTGATTTNLKISDLNSAAFAQVNYNLNEFWNFQAGLRFVNFSLADKLYLEPRVAIKWQFAPNYSVKAAYGEYHQNLKLASQSDLSFFDTWLPTDSTVLPGLSRHYILSFETSPWDMYDLNFDMYYKSMDNVTELNQTVLQGKVVRDLFFIGNEKSYGAEIFLQKKIGNFTGWAGYGLGFIYAKFDSINSGKEFKPKYDRRHDFKLVGQYRLNDSWEFGASFIYQSGQSYTGATSRFQIMLPDQNHGTGKIVPSQRYGLRLPPSHQLNINAAYLFKIFNLKSKLILDIFNVYNRRDIWFRYYNTKNRYTTVEDVKLLPIIPTLSYEIKF